VRRRSRLPSGGLGGGVEDVDQALVGHVVEAELDGIGARGCCCLIHQPFYREVLLALSRRAHDVAKPGRPKQN
jgi:hypothetical protein